MHCIVVLGLGSIRPHQWVELRVAKAKIWVWIPGISCGVGLCLQLCNERGGRSAAGVWWEVAKDVRGMGWSMQCRMRMRTRVTKAMKMKMKMKMKGVVVVMAAVVRISH